MTKPDKDTKRLQTNISYVAMNMSVQTYLGHLAFNSFIKIQELFKAYYIILWGYHACKYNTHNSYSTDDEGKGDLHNYKFTTFYTK